MIGNANSDAFPRLPQSSNPHRPRVGVKPTPTMDDGSASSAGPPIVGVDFTPTLAPTPPTAHTSPSQPALLSSRDPHLHAPAGYHRERMPDRPSFPVCPPFYSNT